MGVSTSVLLGIDPGVAGAIAVLDGESGQLLDVHDTPIVEDGPKGRRRVNPQIITSLIVNVGVSTIKRAYVEKVGVMPREGVVGAFAFGRSVGVIEGILAGLSIPVQFITPQEWKKRLQFPPKADKEFSRGRALQEWPQHADSFKRKKDDGRAEAALIARAGSMDALFKKGG